MKYIKNRNIFLEALRDELSDRQKARVKSVWGEHYLDFERATPSENIELGNWELNQDDKIEVLNSFLKTDLNKLKQELEKIDSKFWTTLLESVDKTKNVGIDLSLLENDFTKPTYNQMVLLYQSIFKPINVSETKADEYVLRDDSGRPIKDENDNIVKHKKTEEEKDKIIFLQKNHCSITKFASDWDILFNTKYNNIFTLDCATIFPSMWTDGIKGEIELFSENPIYLTITPKASDILNMSVSKYFTSCQELYGGGGHGTQYMSGLIYNIFDPNTIPAFLYFDTPYILDGVEISDKIFISRLLIRDIKKPDGMTSEGLFFDESYPNRMRTIMKKIIEKYTNNKSTASSDTYNQFLDIPLDINVTRNPYHDKLGIGVKKILIGKNTKKLKLSDLNSDTIIAKDNSVSEIIINTDKLPRNFFDMGLFKNLKSVIINYIKLSDFKVFNVLNLTKVELHKCYLYANFFNDLDKNLFDLTLTGTHQINFNNIEKTGITNLTIKFCDDLTNVDNILNLKTLKVLSISSDFRKSYPEILEKLKINKVKIKDIGI